MLITFLHKTRGLDRRDLGPSWSLGARQTRDIDVGILLRNAPKRSGRISRYYGRINLWIIYGYALYYTFWCHQTWLAGKWTTLIRDFPNSNLHEFRGFSS